MSSTWWVWVIHGVVNVAMLALAWADLRRVRALERVAWGPSSEPLGRARWDTKEAPNGLSTILHELNQGLQGASAPARVATLNEATTEFEGLLGVARSGALGWRVCCASGIAWACLTVGLDPFTALGCAFSGLVGGGLTWQLGRMADSSARRLRERWNGLIRRLSGSFPQSESVDPVAPVQRAADERSEECQKTQEM